MPFQDTEFAICSNRIDFIDFFVKNNSFLCNNF